MLDASYAGTDYNFGELLPASLSGFVYLDADNDGVKDATESALIGVQLTLQGTDDLGSIIERTTTTDGDGAYRFDGLRPGVYAVTEVQPVGYLDGFEGRNGDVLPGSKSSDAISAIFVTQDSLGGNNNFGELVPGALSGLVYVDSNHDGLQQAAETVLRGVTLTLTGTDDLGSITPRTATTGSDGSFSFGDLRPGSYTVMESQPLGYLDGLDARNGVVIPGSSTSDAVKSILVNQNSSAAANNFGELVPGSLAGLVYLDANHDGHAGFGEIGITSVTLTLTGTDDLGAIAARTATTNSSGAYTFANLRPGTYAVRESQPTGRLDGLDAKDNVVIAGSTTTDVVADIEIAPGTRAAGNNFGELLPGSLTGFVYADDNSDGLKQTGETGLGGVILTLTGTDDQGTILRRTATTDVDGSYRFGDLRPGTYTVTESQPAGYQDGLDSRDGTVIPGSNISEAQHPGLELSYVVRRGLVTGCKRCQRICKCGMGPGSLRTACGLRALRCYSAESKHLIHRPSKTKTDQVPVEHVWDKQD